MNDNRPRMVEVPAELLALCLIALRQCDALMAVSKRIGEFEHG